MRQGICWSTITSRSWSRQGDWFRSGPKTPVIPSGSSWHPHMYWIGYSWDAVSLATSTLVRLLPENFLIHNHNYFVLCIGATCVRRRMIVLPCGGPGCGYTLEHEERLSHCD